MLRHPPSKFARFRLVILLYVLLAVIWAWRLQPARAQTADELRTQRLEQLTRYLVQAPRETLPSLLISIARMSDEKLAQVEDWLASPPLQQLRQLTVEPTPMLENAGTLRDALLLGWLGQETLPSPLPAHFMIAASGDKLDDTMRLFSFRRLADHAMSLGDESTAQLILTRACELPTADWPMVQELVRLSQLHGQKNAALVSLGRWIERQDRETQTSEISDARRLYASLLLRSDRALEALAHLQAILKAVPANHALPARDLELALVCAQSADQSLTMQPWLQRQLSFFPENILSPEELLGKADIAPDYRHWLSESASIADRCLPAPQAYDLCLRLAAAGESSALARICALATPAKRVDDTTRFLHEVLKSPNALQPALLELAQTDRLARRVVTEVLQQRPEDQGLHYAATLAASAQAHPGLVAAIWLSYLRHFPGDLPATRRLIQAHLHARQPHIARRVYDSVDPQSLTAEDRHQLEILSQL